MIEAETATGGNPAHDARTRVAAEAILAIQTPFLDALGRKDPERTDMPALAMATVAVPMAIAATGRALEGIASGGILLSIPFAIAGALVTGVLASIAIVVLWAFEAFAIRRGHLPAAMLPRTYRYALPFLATTGLPNNAFAALCLTTLLCATVIGCARRGGSPATATTISRGMLPPAIGYLSFHVAMTVFFALQVNKGVFALVSLAFSPLFGDP